MSSSEIYRECYKNIQAAGLSDKAMNITREVKIKNTSDSSRHKSSKSIETTNKKLAQKNKELEREVADLNSQLNELKLSEKNHTKGTDQQIMVIKP